MPFCSIRSRSTKWPRPSHQAVEMPPAERKKRMQRMRSAVQDNNVYRWAGKILSALLKFDFPEVP